MLYRVRDEWTGNLSGPLAAREAVERFADESGYELFARGTGWTLRDMDARHIADAESFEALAEALRQRWPEDFMPDAPEQDGPAASQLG